MAMSAFGVEDNRLSKGYGSTAYKRLAAIAGSRGPSSTEKARQMGERAGAGARLVADTVGHKVRSAAYNTGTAARGMAASAGKKVAGAQYAPLHFTRQGIRPTTAGKIYAGGAAGGTAAAGSGYTVHRVRRNKDDD